MKEAVYWREIAGEAPEADLSPPPARVDVLVIGGGYTGLSAALHLADGGAETAVLDATRPGLGASGRNGGMFGAHPRLGHEALSAKFGEDAAMAVCREAPEALDFAKGLIAREGIDCDLQETGRISLAWTKADFEGMKRLAEFLTRETRVRARIVERGDLSDEIGTGRYFGGLVLEEHCGLNPAKYHDGLLAAVRRRGVPVLADCPVTRLTRTGGGFRAMTPRGPVEAERVILATNGYTAAPFRWHARRVFPLPSFLIATAPLSPNLLAKLAPGGRMMVETRARHSYFRLSPDGTRVLWGGRASMRPISAAKAAKKLAATMAEIWPETEGVEITHAWTGNTGYSFTHMPHVGEDDGLHYAMGYSGSGTVMAPYLGAKAAFAALGDDRAETAFARTPFTTSPLHPGGKPHFLKAADLWYRQVVDRVQNLRAARDRAG